MEPVKRGKVRDVYQLSDERIVVVASDRVSAFDKVIPNLEIKNKGKILTEMSERWSFLIDIDNGNEDAWSSELTEKNNYGWSIPTAYCGNCFDDEKSSFLNKPEFDGRTQIQINLDMIPVECIVRGYITGSLWKAYSEDDVRTFCGISLPNGLTESDKLSEPIFTPTTKAPEGKHDENIDFNEMVSLISSTGIWHDTNYSPLQIGSFIRDASIFYYKKANEYAMKHGIIIADTKFEFGISDGWIYLGDEILTPDSSRFWPLDDYKSGRSQRSLDKQIIRDYIAAQKAAGITNIVLPPEIIEQTQEAYQKICDMLFG